MRYLNSTKALFVIVFIFSLIAIDFSGYASEISINKNKNKAYFTSNHNYRDLNGYRNIENTTYVDTVSPYINVEDTCISTLDCYAYDIKLEASAIDNTTPDSLFSWKYIITNIDTWDTIQYSYNYIPLPTSGKQGDKNLDKIDSTSNAEIVILDSLIKGNYLVTWVVKDMFNNEKTENQYLTVVDNKAPSVVIVDIATIKLENGQAEILAKQFDKGGCANGCISSFDNCVWKEELNFTFTDQFPELSLDTNTWQSQYQQYGEYYFDPATGEISTHEKYLEAKADAFVPELNSAKRIILNNGIGNENVPDKIYVWDQFADNDDCDYNNYGYEDIIINIASDYPVNIFGKINYNDSDKGFTGMIMKADDEESMTIDTSKEGDFVFGLPSGKYIITGNSEENYREDISTIDLILFKNYQRGVYSSFDLRGVWAMDVDKYDLVSGSDYIQIVDLLLHKIDKFNNYSWIAISKKYDYYGQFDLKKELFKASRDTVIIEDENSTENVDFYALKMGDVDLSSGKDTIIKSKPDLQLWVEDADIGRDSSIVVPVRSSNMDDVAGIQFSLDLGSLELEAFESGLIDSNDIHYNVFDNKLLFIWTGFPNIKFNENDVLFSLKLKADSTSTIKDNLKLSGKYLSPEVYTGLIVKIHDLIFTVKNANSTNENINRGFVLYQNKPNPFKNITEIGFKTDKVAGYSLTLYDLTGRILKKFSGTAKPGYNSIKINTSDISYSGVLFYKIKTADYMSVKKMIKL